MKPVRGALCSSLLQVASQPGRAAAWPCSAARAVGRAAFGAINYQAQNMQAKGHNDINFCRLHQQQALPAPSLCMTKWLSRWHPGFPPRRLQAATNYADLCLLYLFQKQNPGLLSARESGGAAAGLPPRHGAGARPGQGPAWPSGRRGLGAAPVQRAHGHTAPVPRALTRQG